MLEIAPNQKTWFVAVHHMQMACSPASQLLTSMYNGTDMSLDQGTVLWPLKTFGSHTSKQMLSMLARERSLLELEYKLKPDCAEPSLRYNLIGAPQDVVRGLPSTCFGAKLLFGSQRLSVLRSQREQKPPFEEQVKRLHANGGLSHAARFALAYIVQQRDVVAAELLAEPALPRVNRAVATCAEQE